MTVAITDLEEGWVGGVGVTCVVMDMSRDAILLVKALIDTTLKCKVKKYLPPALVSLL